jgi:hypothetical protein
MAAAELVCDHSDHQGGFRLAAAKAILCHASAETSRYYTAADLNRAKADTRGILVELASRLQELLIHRHLQQFEHRELWDLVREVRYFCDRCARKPRNGERDARIVHLRDEEKLPWKQIAKILKPEDDLTESGVRMAYKRFKTRHLSGLP